MGSGYHEPMSELVPIVVPDSGFEDQPVRLNLWLIALGNQVTVGDRVAEVSLPGLLVPVKSPATGKLVRFEVRSGSDVAVGQTIAFVEPAN